MKFDNSKFEANIKTSMRSISDLKNSLNFKGAEKSFDELEKASKKLNFDSADKAISGIKAKLENLGSYIAAGAWMKLGADIGSFIYRTVDDFTFAPVKSGLQEYEMKMGSVQTIMSATGEDIKVVNDYLEDLNKYSDDTIYSFKDMTASIGKFTNSGVKLEDAVIAMKGISNEAAVSGANAQEASRAMYNLAQSLSMGYVQYIDWKSIENANMATVEFKQNLAETAVQMGIIKKKSNGMFDVYGNEYSLQQLFKDALKEEWLTNDVLISTLKDYADETTEIGKKAYAAAKDVKTFSMMMDTLKEAAQSGWSQTFEILFGNLEEAKKLWTGISNTLGAVIENSSNRRNNFLKNALGKDVVTYEQIIELERTAGINEVEMSEMLLEAARNHGITMDGVIDTQSAIMESLKSGWLTYEMFGEIVKGTDVTVAESTEDMEKRLLEYEKVARSVLNGKYGNGAKRKKLLEEAGYNYQEIQSMVNKLYRGEKLTVDDLLESEEKQITYSESYLETIKRLNEEAKIQGMSLAEYMETMNGMSRREKLIAALAQTFKALGNYVSALGAGWKAVFKEDFATSIGNLINKYYEFSKSIDTSHNLVWYGIRGFAISIASILHAIGTTLYEIGRVIGTLASVIVPKIIKAFSIFFYESDYGFIELGQSFEAVVHKIGDFLVRLIKTTSESEKAQKVFRTIGKIIRSLAAGFRSFAKSMSNVKLGSFRENLSALGHYGEAALHKLIDVMKQLLYTLVGYENGEKIINKFKNAITSMKDKLSNTRWPSMGEIMNITDGLEEYLEQNDKASNIVDRLIGTVEFLAMKIKTVFQPAIEDLTGGMSTSSSSIDEIIKNILLHLQWFKDGVVGTFNYVKEKIVAAFEFIKSISLGQWLQIMNTVVWGSLIYNIVKVLDMIKELQKAVKGFIVQSSKAVARISKGFAKMELAIALFVIAKTIQIIASIPTSQIVKGLVVIGVIAALLQGTIWLVGWISKEDPTKARTFSRVLVAVERAILTMVGSTLIIIGSIIVLAMIAKQYKLEQSMDYIISASVAVLVVMGILTGLSWALSKFGGDHGSSGAATMILAMTASLALIAGGIWALCAVMDTYGDMGYFNKAIGILLGALAAMTVAGVILSRFGGMGPDGYGAALMVVALAGSMILIVKSFSSLLKVYSSAVESGALSEVTFVIITALLCGIMLTMGKAISDMMKASEFMDVTALMALASSLVLMGMIMANLMSGMMSLSLNGMDGIGIAAAMLGISVLIQTMSSILPGIVELSKNAGNVTLKNLAKIGAVMLGLSVLAGVLGAVIGTHTKSNNWAGMIGSAVAISIVLAALVGIVKLLDKIKMTNTAEVFIGIGAMAVSIIAIAAALGILAMIPSDKLIQAGAALGIVTVALAAAMLLLSKVKINMTGIAFDFIMFAGACSILSIGLSFLAGAMAELGEVDFQTFFGDMAVLVIGVGLLALLGKFAEGSAFGLIVLAGAIAVIAVALAILTLALTALLEVAGRFFGIDMSKGTNSVIDDVNDAGRAPALLNSIMGTGMEWGDMLVKGFDSVIDAWNPFKKIKDKLTPSSAGVNSYKNQSNKAFEQYFGENANMDDAFTKWLHDTGRAKTVVDNYQYWDKHRDEFLKQMDTYRSEYIQEKNRRNQTKSDYYAQYYGAEQAEIRRRQEMLSTGHSDIKISSESARIAQEKANGTYDTGSDVMDDYAESVDGASSSLEKLLGLLGISSDKVKDVNDMFSGEGEGGGIFDKLFGGDDGEGGFGNIFDADKIQSTFKDLFNPDKLLGGFGEGDFVIPFTADTTSIEDQLASVGSGVDMGDPWGKYSNLQNGALGTKNVGVDVGEAALEELRGIHDTTNTIRDNSGNYVMTLDGKVVAGRITSQVDRNMGARTRMKARGV